MHLVSTSQCKHFNQKREYPVSQSERFPIHSQSVSELVVYISETPLLTKTMHIV